MAAVSRYCGKNSRGIRPAHEKQEDLGEQGDGRVEFDFYDKSEVDTQISGKKYLLM